MFAGLAPLPGGTPWYYDGLPGIGAASHVMVPHCAADPKARDHALGLMDARGIELEKVGESDDFRLYRIRR